MEKYNLTMEELIELINHSNKVIPSNLKTSVPLHSIEIKRYFSHKGIEKCPKSNHQET